MARKYPSITDELAMGPYRPQYDPVDTQITNPVSNPEQVISEAVESVKKKVRELDPTKSTTIKTRSPAPLTAVEAAVIIQEKEALKLDILITRERISKIRSNISDLVKPDGGADLAFKTNLAKKSAIRRAVQKAFGVKTDEITYEMYQIALELKHKLGQEQQDAYVNRDY